MNLFDISQLTYHEYSNIDGARNSGYRKYLKKVCSGIK